MTEMATQKKGTVTPPPRSPFGSRLLRGSGGSPSSSSLSDEAMWRRLKEAGFDDDMIRRRDKAALVAYISKLETELYDYQHHMGLLIIEKKEWMSKYEQIKATADLAEITYRRDQAVHLSAVSEAKKREESLKKALGIEKECTANIEKALHELRAECAETKVAAEFKLAEAQKLLMEAQQKSDEAENRIHASESLHAEAGRCDRNASRKLQDVEAREDELRRRLVLSKTEWDAKEKELSLERQSINDTQKLLQHEQEKLVERQSYLNHREEHIFTRLQELDNLEKELEAARANIDKDLLSIKQGKLDLESDMSALAIREEAVAEKEAQLDKKEMDLLKMQETLASEEKDEIQRLKSEYESTLVKRNSEFEADVAQRVKLVEAELDVKKQTVELREADADLREKGIQGRENVIEMQLKALVEKEADLAKKLHTLCQKEESASLAQKAAEKERLELQKEREETRKMHLVLEEAKKSIEDEKNQVILQHEKIEETINERSELLILETKLKEEIDSFRAKKMEFIAEAETLRAEKEKFEQEWELIDEKKDKLQKEAERIAEEKNAACQYLKNEHDRLKLEKDILQKQFKADFESLSCEREEMIVKMEREHSEWFSKIQHERDTFVEEITLQKRELEICIEKRSEEVEAYLREREEAFEKEKAQELQKIHSQMDMIAKELDHVEMEKEKLNIERMGIIEDRAMRDREWSEIKNFIDDLNIQRKKLQEQRELLITDKEEIHAKIQHLKELQDLNIASENRALSESKIPGKVAQKVHVMKCSSRQQTLTNTVEDLNEQMSNGVPGSVRNLPPKIPTDASTPISATFSWIRKCADVILKRSPERIIDANTKKNVESMVPIQQGYLNSNASEIEYPAKNRSIITSSKLVTEKFNLKKSLITELPSASPSAEGNDVEITASTEKRCTVQADSSSSQELEEKRSRFVENEINDSSLGRKRRNDTSAYIGSNPQFESSEKCQKRQRQYNVAEGSPVESLSEIINSSRMCQEETIGLMPLEQNLRNDRSAKVYKELEQNKETFSTEHAEISQVVKGVSQSDNLAYREPNGNGLLSDCPESLSAEGNI